MRCCSSTAVQTRFVGGEFLLRFTVTNREKLGMLDRKGHVSGDVAYASWPASLDKLNVPNSYAVPAGVLCAMRTGAFIFTFVLV